MQAEKISSWAGEEALSLHHAYLIAGDREEAISDILAFLQKIKNFELRGNPDLHVSRFDVLTIDDARRVKDIAERKAFGNRKVIIAAFNTATTEAQNSLLKTLEEPGERTHFFLIVPRAQVLLPTVSSRLYIIDTARPAGSAAKNQAQEFLSASPAERLTLAKKIADDIFDGDLEKQFTVDLIGQLEKMLWETRGKSNIAQEAFDDLALCRKYISDRSSSVKMLLEHLALILPPISSKH